ncbi:5-oxoprolinase subunit PxpA [Kangiella shandongensis]|uniref:5-oxoprolinase subunit PxpA n=1 Tax=Kangiella shandongensis TaxID=2763258 RepID=UPI001CBC9CA5|nr:5-oxoprolinase subunit PxpA [Kangiella shandongensis]
MTIDINCDLGESTEPEQWERDALLMPYISSCNIACGGHAGNKRSIEVSVRNAFSHSLAIGAHPSYPDKVNFGRRSIAIDNKSLRQTISEQISQVLEACESQRTSLRHVKPHGALYNDAAKDLELSTLVAEEIAQISPDIKLMGLAESAMYEAAQKVGIDFIHEGFMDRNYQTDKTLIPRTQQYALHNSLEDSLNQALNFALSKPISTPDNVELKIIVDSICLHGDNPNALSIAKQLYERLQEHEFRVRAPI